ncbi:MAG: type II toxin-antitoxin system VapC family toxin [Pyrinomonadaceae bacterium]
MFVTDTHALVWYTTQKTSRLSKKANAAFEKANKGEIVISIPSIVLFEIAMLERDGEISLQDGFLNWSRRLRKKTGFLIEELTPTVAYYSARYNFNTDPFDRIIVATAVELDLPLIARDVAIAESNLVEVYW